MLKIWNTVDLELARNYCLKLPEVEEYDHFGKLAYGVKRKIVATLWWDEKRAVLKLSTADQEFFSMKYSSVIIPVKGKWGKLGWTYVDLNKINEVSFSKVLTEAWLNVAPKALSKKINQP